MVRTVLPLSIGRYALLHCCCTAVVVSTVGGWVVGGGRLVGDRSGAPLEGGESQESANKSHPAPGAPQVYRRGAYCRTVVLPLWIGWYVVLHCCCTAVVEDWSVGGGCLVGAWWVTARALPRRVENYKKVPVPPSSWHTTGVPLWCVLPYCCAAVVDWSVRSAPLLLHCCGIGLVGGWVVGGGCLVGDCSRSPPEGGES